MTNEVFSNHIGGASELTVLASIKPSFVPCRLLISYAARLRIHLRMLSTLRRFGLEGRRAGVYTGPLDSLRTLQYIRWTLIDDDTRMLLAVNFDRPLEPYLRRIVDIAGPLLDTILCHCEGFEGHSSDQGFHKFMEFANAHQAPIELFAAANPNLSVDDADYFVKVDRKLREQKVGGSTAPAVPVEQLLTEVRLERPEDRLAQNAAKNPLALLDQGLSIVETLYNNAHLFIDGDSANRDGLLYYRLLERLTPGFWGGMFRRLPAEVRNQIEAHLGRKIDPFDLKKEDLPPINNAYKAAYKQAEAKIANTPDIATLPNEIQVVNLINQHSDALNWYAEMPDARAREIQAPPADFRQEVQQGLINNRSASPRTDDYDVGCLMLLRIDDAEKGRAFLSGMEEKLGFGSTQPVQVNLSITHAGLKSLKIPDNIIQEFPVAFREGMAARAGMLGDVDVNNPTEWVWPKSNWISRAGGAIEAGQNEAILPETIDVIITLVKPHNAEVSEFSTSHPLFIDVEGIAQLFGDGVSLIGIEPVLRKFVGDERNKVEGHLGFADGISQPKFDEPKSAQSGQYEVPNIARRETETDRTLIGDLLLGHPSKADLDLAKPNSIREEAKHIKPYPEYKTPRSKPKPPPDPKYKNTPLENGTFQVIRKLQVNKREFQKIPPEVQEQMIGRTRTGQPLVGGTTSANAFNYELDRVGHTTPLQSHIRRANPREADTPRILRRGFSYGPFNDQSANRGLMFIAYNANIAEQFEVIQRWISGGNSTGISSYHGDALLAPQRSDSTRTFRYFKHNKVNHVDLPKTPPVILQWGLYAFTPSRTGLQWLSTVQTSEHQPKVPVSPTPRLKAFSSAASRDRWRLAIEDHDEERRQERIDIWKEVRGAGGAADAKNYAVLVGSADGVKQVLEDTESFSVREYWKRMLDSTGVIHLGMDPNPVATESVDSKDKELDQLYRNGDPKTQPVKPGDYLKRSAPVNAFFRGLTPDILFNDALKEAQDLLSKLPDEVRYLPKDKPTDNPAPDKEGRHVVATQFFYDLVARLCVKWLGIPGTDSALQIGGPESHTPHCPNDLVRASFYAFWPHPSSSTINDSRARTQAFRDNVRAYVKAGPSNHQDTLLGALLTKTPQPTAAEAEQMADMVVGVSSGFAGPTGGSFRFVMFDWIETGLLWRLQQKIRHSSTGGTYAEMKPILEPAILDSMAKRAAPDILHREAVKKTKIGSEEIEAGKRIVIGLRSAAEDAVAKPGVSRTEEQRFFLFGGNYENKTDTQPLHACPGQTMALCTMMAAFAAIMEYEEIRPEGPLSFRLR